MGHEAAPTLDTDTREIPAASEEAPQARAAPALKLKHIPGVNSVQDVITQWQVRSIWDVTKWNL